MIERKIRAVAEVFGLTVEKKIRTGTEQACFADFVLRGSMSQVCKCWAAVQPELYASGHKQANLARLAHEANEDYVEILSVWCETPRPPLFDEQPS